MGVLPLVLYGTDRPKIQDTECKSNGGAASSPALPRPGPVAHVAPVWRRTGASITSGCVDGKANGHPERDESCQRVTPPECRQPNPHNSDLGQRVQEREHHDRQNGSHFSVLSLGSFNVIPSTQVFKSLRADSLSADR